MFTMYYVRDGVVARLRGQTCLDGSPRLSRCYALLTSCNPHHDLVDVLATCGCERLSPATRLLKWDRKPYIPRKLARTGIVGQILYLWNRPFDCAASPCKLSSPCLGANHAAPGSHIPIAESDLRCSTARLIHVYLSCACRCGRASR